ncbi:MAG: hypothetical protein R3F11_10700 [Verrucomicrobiales bacterium]
MAPPTGREVRAAIARPAPVGSRAAGDRDCRRLGGSRRNALAAALAAHLRAAGRW